MIKHINNFFLLIIILLSLISCKKELELRTHIIDFSFLDTTLKTEFIYIFDSIYIDAEINRFDTFSFLIKERIDTFFFIDNQKIYRLERYKKENNINKWQLTDIWHFYIYKNNFIKVEENIPYVKINFPIELKKQWDGNMFNNLDKQIYLVDSIIEKNNKITCYITHYYKESLVDKYHSYEAYTKNIGLTEKSIVNIYSSYFLPHLPIEKRIKKGILKKLKLIEKINKK